MITFEPMDLRFDFKDETLKQFFKQFEDNFEEPYDALEKMRLIIQKDIKSHFDDASSPQGRWTARKKQYPHPILIKSGALKRGIRAKVIPKRTGMAIEVTPSAKTSAYAFIHNYGPSEKNQKGKPWTFIPQRRYAWVSQQARDKIEKVWLNRMRRTD